MTEKSTRESMADELKDLMQVYSQRGLSEWTRDAQHGVR